MSNENSRFYEFSQFRLDPDKKRLWHQGQPILLPHKAMDVFVALIERPGKIVEREELMQLVWGDLAVEDANLTVAISTLRRVLSQYETLPLIETLPRIGYRFTAEVRDAPAAEPPILKQVEAKEVKPPILQRRLFGRRNSTIACSLIILITVFLWAGWKWNKQPQKKTYTPNPEAYQLCLQGGYLHDKQTLAEVSKAIALFQQAIAKDPAYAVAYTKLATSYLTQGHFNAQSPKQDFILAKQFALQSVALDPNLSETYAVLAATELDQLQAIKYSQRAIELNPNIPDGRLGMGYCYLIHGRFEEVRAEFRKAVELNPLSFKAHHLLALTYYFGREYDKAITQCKYILELESSFDLARITIGDAYLQQNRYDAAIAEYRKADSIIEDEASDDQIAVAFALSGNRAAAISILNNLKAEARKTYISPFNLARICVSLGEKDEAITYLQQAYQDQVGEIRFLKVDPRFERLHTDPRFVSLLQQMNLTL